jgi:phospholipase/lecithinase/hemolysin
MRTLTTSLLLAAGATLSYAAAFNPHFDLKSFTALVIFGDSFTDQGVHSYTPFPNGTLPDTVSGRCISRLSRLPWLIEI